MDLAILEAASAPFLGRWQRLISTTNWDKGRIILDWRTALSDAGADVSAYSDDAWSRQVGGVTPQHVGRLRRVFERFGEVREGYDGLYWSHFQAALDWDDAEMWLEGAVQNDWSVSVMRRTRWETLGALDGERPQEEDVVTSELDEDAEPTPDPLALPIEGKVDVARDPRGAADRTDQEADWSGDSYADDRESDEDHSEHDSERPVTVHSEPVRPFAHLASLPADVSDVFENFKLCILKHKLAGWVEIAREDLLASLDALKQLALSESGD